MAAVLLVALAFVPATAHQGVDLGELHGRALDGFGVALIVAQGAPVAVARRWPGTCLAVVGVAFCLYQLLGYPTTVAALGLLVVLVHAGAVQGRRLRVVVASAVSTYVALALALSAAGSPVTVTDYAVFGTLLAALFLAGTWVRTRADATDARRRRAEREAVGAERARIARELHDVVTHHVTAIVVQAEAARYGPADRAGAGLETIAEEGRAALADLRVLLGALDGEPRTLHDPATTDLWSIVDRAVAAGQPVELVERGDARPLAGAPGLVVTRVVQESLTNAIKHAPGAPTRVLVAYEADRVAVEVVMEGAVVRAAGPAALGKGAGRGLIGLRERVALVGGELTAEPRGSVFVVSAQVPA